MSYKLGILDQSPIFPGKSAEEALASTVQFVQKAEKWGYDRFWVSEHHQSLDLAGTSPEVLVSHLLAKTNTIKIGSGGVMLQHYSPYKVAENFHLLSSLTPGRVELGVGKAPGGFAYSTEALRYGGAGSAITFEERFTTLNQFLRDTLPEDHELFGAKVLPVPKKEVPLFLLGSSPSSAKLAAEQGADFVFAHFFNSNHENLEETVSTYQSIYPEGNIILAVSSYAAETQVEAEKMENYKVYKAEFKSGRSLNLATWEQVEELREQEEEAFSVKEQQVEVIAGTSEFVKDEFDKLATAYGVNQFIIHTPIRDEAKRWKSYELLSPLATPLLSN